MLLSVEPSADPAKKRAVATFTSNAPRIDGKVDPVWLRATEESGFTQNTPIEGAPATNDTRFFILYDTENIYVLFVMLDSDARSIPARLVDRDHRFYPYDSITFYLDTYNDNIHGYYFSTNPLGVEQDGLISQNGAIVDLNWDGIFRVSADRNQFGWVAEFAIPFKTLRFDGDLANQVWGINVWRVRNKNHELSYWSLVGREYPDEVRLDKGGILTGLRNIHQGSNISLIPYVTGRRIGKGSDYEDSGKGGFDLKYGLSSNLTLDFTLNPDFGQVEIDEEQINLDKRFEIELEEKRPFFLENKNLFELAPFQLFYSRRVGALSDIKGGAKLTGKIGSYSVGFLEALTGDWSNSGFGDTEKAPPDELFSVFRVQKDLPQSSNIGFTMADREVNWNSYYQFGKDAAATPDNSYQYNRTAGADWNIFLGPTEYFSGQLAYSANSYDPSGLPTPGGREGFAGYAQFGHYDQRYHLNFQAMHYDPEFDINGTGFFQKLSTKGKDQFGLYGDIHPFLNRSFARLYRLSTNLLYIRDTGETLPAFGVQNLFYLETQNLSYLELGFNIYREVETDLLRDYFDPTTFHNQLEYWGRDFSAKVGTDEGRTLSIELKANYDTQYYYQTHSVGNNKGLEGSLRFQPISNGFLELEYKQHWLIGRNKKILPVLTYGQTEIELWTVRTRYLLTRNLFSRAFVQYTNAADSIDYGQPTIVPDRWDLNIYPAHRLSANFMLGWRFRPGSTFYLAYTEEWDTRTTVHLQTKNRIVFAKLSYYWSF